MPKRLGLCCAGWCGALLALSTSALAQSKGSPAQPESTLWDHNGSVMYLIAQGAAREFHYKEPRAAMARRERVPVPSFFAAQSRTASLPARHSSSTAIAARCPIRSADRSSIMTSASCLSAKRRWSAQSAGSRDTSPKS